MWWPAGYRAREARDPEQPTGNDPAGHCRPSGSDLRYPQDDFRVPFLTR